MGVERAELHSTQSIFYTLDGRLTVFLLKVGMDPNLVRGKKSKGDKYESEYDEEENDELLKVESQDTIEHKNLLKYRAEILKYQGMCLQYQASLLEKEATQLSSASGLQFKHQETYEYEASPTRRDQRRSEDMVRDRKPFLSGGCEDSEAPLDLPTKYPPAPAHLHTQSEHMPRIFFSKFSTNNIKF